MVAPSELSLAVASLACLFTLLSYFLWSSRRDRADRDLVPMRIHVGGTRGKSTVVRLVTAGLQEAGYAALGKVTGSHPTVIDADGTDLPWRRRGLATVREQARFLRYARRARADVAVIECMAVSPEYLWASEHRLVAAHLTIVTNARPDHWEVLGVDDRAMARALVEIVPQSGQVIAADELATDPEALAGFEHRARTLGTRVSLVPTEGRSPTAAMYALALRACASLGVPEEIARRGMDRLGLNERPTVRPMRFRDTSRAFRFVDAFACNDPASLRRLVEAAPEGVARPDVVLLHARADRPLRTKRMLEFVPEVWPDARVVLVGHAGPRGSARSFGEGRERRNRTLAHKEPEAVVRELERIVPNGGAVWGIGNHVGFADAFAHALDSATVACSPSR